MEGSLYALLSVLSTALLRVTLKHCAVNTTSALTTLTLYHIGGFLVLLPFLGVPTLAALSQDQIALLCATGVLITLAGFLDIIAMKHIDASAGEVFHTLTFIVSVAAGFLMFHEACSISKVAGTTLIAGGIMYEARRGMLQASHALWLKLGSAALIASAMIITKHLTAHTPAEAIILSGFIIPGMLYAAFGFKDLRDMPSVVRSSQGVILIVPILDAMSYTFGIKALAAGEMSTTYILFQTTITAVFVLEVLLNGWRREAHLHRAVSASLCMCGALIAVIG
jgi:drug/metabolite transporter (DMT)-like permease